MLILGYAAFLGGGVVLEYGIGIAGNIFVSTLDTMLHTSQAGIAITIIIATGLAWLIFRVLIELR